jgi:membrane protein
MSTGPQKSDPAQSEAVEHSKRWLLDFFPNLKDAGVRWSEDDAGSLAASVAYYLALSLFPMILLLISGLGIFLRYTQFGIDIQQEILDTVETQTTPELRFQVDQVLDHLATQSLVGGPTGLFTAILAAIGVFAQIDRGFDRIFRIAPQKDASLLGTVFRVIRSRFAAFLMLLSLGGLLVVLFFVGMGITQVRSLTSQTLPSVGHLFNLMDLLTTILVNAMLFTLIYRILPKRPVIWLDAFRGGVTGGCDLGSGPWAIGSILHRHALHDGLWSYRIVHRVAAVVLLRHLDFVLRGRVCPSSGDSASIAGIQKVARFGPSRRSSGACGPLGFDA